MPRTRLPNSRYIIRLIGLAAVYFVAAKLGLSLAFTVKQVTTVWPPTAIAITALLFFGYDYWPGVFLGAFLANLFTREPVTVAAGIAVGNSLEALAGAYLLRRLDFRDNLDTLRAVLTMVIAAAILSPLLSATIGTASLWAGRLVGMTALNRTWMTWWVGDMMGVIIFMPLLLVGWRREYLRPLFDHKFEAALMLALLFAVTTVAFVSRGLVLLHPSSYVFPFMIWAALRFRQIGAIVASLVVSLVAIWATLIHLGPFASTGSTNQGLLMLQIFMLVLAVSSLILAVITDEQQRISDQLRTHARELEEAHAKLSQDLEERDRLEQDLKEANKRITDILAGILDNGER